MLDRRRRAILRQMIRPPYVHRWMTLLAGTYVIVVLTAAGIEQVGATAPIAVEQTGTPTPAPAATAPTPVPSAVLTGTGSSGRTVALTFDDGPHPVYTPQVLAVLDEYRVPAVFCMVSHNAMEQWKVARDVVAAGHAVCDHTSDHDAGLARATPDAVARAMRISTAELVAATGNPDMRVRFFRAPQGVWTPDLENRAAAQAMRPLGWSVDSRDWTGASPEQIVTTIESELRDGSVVLMHDGGGNREKSVEALRTLIPRLQDEGYRFVLPDGTAPAAPAQLPQAATGR